MEWGKHRVPKSVDEPGHNVRPPPSTVTAPVIAGCSAGSIALIVSPSTRTLRPVWSLSDLPSKTRTLVKTTGAACCGRLRNFF